MTLHAKQVRFALLILTSAVMCCSLAWVQSSSSAANVKPSPGTTELASVADATIPSTTSAGKPHDAGFIIGADDILAISVWKEADISRTVPVRSDGKISLPLIGEVQASG